MQIDWLSVDGDIIDWADFFTYFAAIATLLNKKSRIRFSKVYCIEYLSKKGRHATEEIFFLNGYFPRANISSNIIKILLDIFL